MDITTDDQILDLACGTGKNAGLMANFLGEKGSITGIDVSPVMGKQFMEKHGSDSRFDFKQERIDVPFQLEKKYGML